MGHNSSKISRSCVYGRCPQRIINTSEGEQIIKTTTLVSAALILFCACEYVASAAGPANTAAKQELPQLINSGQLKWVKTIPSAGNQSPEYAILHVNPHTHLTTLMFRTPVPVHIKPHTHSLAETHIVLSGGTHVFEANGVRYNLEKGGYLRMPGGMVHEAWLPAGSQTLNIEESGWAVNWLHGGPSQEDVEQMAPPAGPG